MESVGLAIIIATVIVIIATSTPGGGDMVAAGDVCGIAAATENSKEMLQGVIKINKNIQMLVTIVFCCFD